MRRLRPALEQLSQVAIRLQITHGLLAIDTLPDISAYDQIWLGSQWLPKTERLSLKQAVVVLSSGKIYNQQAIETLLMLNRNHVKFDFQFFSQSVSAMHWLTNESRRLPALLAEWDSAFGPMEPEASQVAEPRAPYRRP
ncbi:hypothetical protein [Hymenobacter sp. BT559]|uniref:hypothetical protein n=1 Tax=Hymenobacter sp. BT559 TaxID=2795729 RepID=UPI0018EBC00A|nr:hypothetical protein [Hymenobacter sp. BT559]